MTERARWRENLFATGWCLLFTSGAAIVAAWMRAPHLIPMQSGNELAVWIWGGLLVTSTSLLLILFGSGWKRWVFIACALVELILWYDFAMMAAQLLA